MQTVTQFDAFTAYIQSVILGLHTRREDNPSGISRPRSASSSDDTNQYTGASVSYDLLYQGDVIAFQQDAAYDAYEHRN